jgi:uncharacterized membrane protein
MTLEQPPRLGTGGPRWLRGRSRLPSWRREELRTTFWLVPVILVALACLLFFVTVEIDIAAYNHHFSFPSWIRTESADAGRTVLIAIATAVMSVAGVVFSITILALTLASQQFGPRMMRNFVRDLGNQLTLGVFVATFVYCVLAMGSITEGAHGPFVPRVSIFVAEALTLLNIAVLIYFIHHIAKSIQLPEVIAGIARDLMRAIDAEFPVAVGSVVEDSRAATAPGGPGPPATAADPLEPVEEVARRIEEEGALVRASTSGYLQFVSYAPLVEIAERFDGVIRLEHRPGHFVMAGRPLAKVLPAVAASQVSQALADAHVTGPHRTLTQDPVFAIDQLVEIGIRALSPAVNDTFTALTCIDWLAAGLGRVSGRSIVEGVYRDKGGRVRLVESDPSYARMVNRAFDKVRQAASGMPAVIIRLLDSLGNIAEATTSAEQRQVLVRQADMILSLAEASVREENDLEDIRRRHRRVMAVTQAA